MLCKICGIHLFMMQSDNNSFYPLCISHSSIDMYAEHDFRESFIILTSVEMNKYTIHFYYFLQFPIKFVSIHTHTHTYRKIQVYQCDIRR